jgi:hypothetical protein
MISIIADRVANDMERYESRFPFVMRTIGDPISGKVAFATRKAPNCSATVSLVTRDWLRLKVEAEREKLSR